MLNNKNKLDGKDKYEALGDMDFDRFNKIVDNDVHKNDDDPFFDKSTDTDENIDFDIDDDDGDYQSKKEKRLQSMYVINLTPARMGVLLGVLSSLVLIMFVLGFQFGVKKNINNVVSVNDDVLFRTSENQSIDMNDLDNLVANNSTGIVKQASTKTDIVEMSLLSENTTDNATILGDSKAMYASDDIDSMLSKDLEDMGDILNIKKEEQDAQSILDNYLISEPASYIDGEKNTSSVSFPNNKNYNKPVAVSKPKSSSSKYSSDEFVYFIQVAVANSEKSANTEKDYLKTKNFAKAFVVDGIGKDGSAMYKLKIGRYETKGEAQEVLTKLKNMSNKYSDSYIYPDKR